MPDDTAHERSPEPRLPAYEPPTVERVIGAEELAREVHYAGAQVSGQTGGGSIARSSHPNQEAE
jgi:hypothetical protein